jgi:hypothetical protein
VETVLDQMCIDDARGECTSTLDYNHYDLSISIVKAATSRQIMLESVAHLLIQLQFIAKWRSYPEVGLMGGRAAVGLSVV